MFIYSYRGFEKMVFLLRKFQPTNYYFNANLRIIFSFQPMLNSIYKEDISIFQTSSIIYQFVSPKPTTEVDNRAIREKNFFTRASMD